MKNHCADPTDSHPVTVKAVNGARYTVPSMIHADTMDDQLTVRFRVGAVYKNAYVSVYFDEQRVIHKKKKIMAPGEMEQVVLQKKQIASVPDLKNVTICIEQD